MAFLSSVKAVLLERVNLLCFRPDIGGDISLLPKIIAIEKVAA